jgi:hypothetical protein
MPYDPNKMKWFVVVYYKDNDSESIDHVVIVAYQKQKAERLAVLFTADDLGEKTSKLYAKAEKFDSSKHKAVTHETHEYLAAADTEEG